MSNRTTAEIPPTFSAEFLAWFRDRTEWYYVWSSGLGAEAISRVETQWQLEFPPDYRLFLEALHAPERPAAFYNWLEDSGSIAEAFEWLVEGLEFDVQADVLWLPSWGLKPEKVEEQSARLRALVDGAAKLIPVTGHRYLVAEPCQAGNPVLSIYQSDIIVYGGNLREYFFAEFMSLLGLSAEQKQEVTRSVQEGINEAYDNAQTIPFWGELLVWNSL